MGRIALALLVLMFAGAAYAQTVNGASGSDTGSLTMKDLLEQDYEIKAAVPNGSNFVIFMQKEQSAYACTFSSTTKSRCGAIN